MVKLTLLIHMIQVKITITYNFYHFNETKKELKETFINKDKSFNYRNKLNLIFIHSNNKNILSDEEKKKMNEIIVKSNNFLSPSSSLDLYVFKKNNIIPITINIIRNN